MKRTSKVTSKTLRTFGLIAFLGSLPLVASLTGCAGDRYTQSTGEYIDDKADSARVRKTLSEDTQYKYSDVKVQTFKGVVQLSGFVNSKDEKKRAGDLAKTVEGIKEVKNDITIKESSR